MTDKTYYHHGQVDGVPNCVLGWSMPRRVLVVVLVCMATLAACRGGDPSPPTALVLLEPAPSAGPDPFMASVATAPEVAFPANVRASTAGFRKALPADPTTKTLIATGTTAGLYGGSADVHVCDPQQLVTFLAEHQDKAAAWARVFGIAPNDIAGYVATLTPVVLMSDTLVTNHGYRNGVATSLQSVLQAGTAVLVDRTGTPRVKCNCGNPLAPPEALSLAKAKTQGPAWLGYSPAAVTVVQAGGSTNTLIVVDINTGDHYSESTGGTPRSQSAASTGSVICSLVFPNGVGDGNHCAVSNLKMSTVNPDWVYAAIALDNADNQVASDVDSVIANLSSHQVIGPTNVGFCGVGPTAGSPIAGYSAVPANVLAGFGLSACAASTPATSVAPPVPPTLPTGSSPYAFLAGSWGAHEMTLVISTTGSGHLGYADLTLCPNCSFGGAPGSTADFVLRSVSNDTAEGSVTASSDPKVFTTGEPVTVTLTPGSAGQILQLDIGGQTHLNFCNSTSAGQCGA